LRVKLLKQGTAEELAEDELVRKVYLGRNFVLRRANDIIENKVD
jgi:lipopolysaccharide export system ATP-binding protein